MMKDQSSKERKTGMTKLILMRHGESMWNKLNYFTGWVDVPLSSQGVEEALAGGKKIREIPIDVIFTSTLIRAQETAVLAMTYHQSGKVPVIIHQDEGKLAQWSMIHGAEAQAMMIPVYRSWHLNERMYGELQGLNKRETAERFGQEQVHIWRRSYDVSPPEGESLEKTAERTIPYFKETILPFIQQGKNVFIAAHGNSLRSIVMELEGLTKEEIVRLELTLGEPILYDYVEGKFIKTLL
ncbi:2,3-bisphosphoglycerate-dependent phosphoglycerate mutase [Chlamydiales bacterium STE3]|nr:2,3-bisphosphoglycerate-dependent phosphoglycerate mutase [Chlamydiales bacterium STE3]